MCEQQCAAVVESAAQVVFQEALGFAPLWLLPGCVADGVDRVQRALEQGHFYLMCLPPPHTHFLRTAVAQGFLLKCTSIPQLQV